MKLSTRSRYGVRMMYELAVNYGKDPVILKDIAARQDISEKYLSKLIIPLKGARLVNSSRGSHGGYLLARDPSKITLREIVEILEGDITPVECVKNKAICGRSGSCPTRDIWCRLDSSIAGFLDGITLDAIVKGTGSDERCPSYCI
jgi:Rrf2 family protein